MLTLQVFKQSPTVTNIKTNVVCPRVRPQEKYPSVVSLPGGSRSEVMTLSHPELPG